MFSPLSTLYAPSVGEKYRGPSHFGARPPTVTTQASASYKPLGSAQPVQPEQVEELKTQNMSLIDRVATNSLIERMGLGSSANPKAKPTVSRSNPTSAESHKPRSQQRPQPPPQRQSYQNSMDVEDKHEPRQPAPVPRPPRGTRVTVDHLVEGTTQEDVKVGIRCYCFDL